MTATTEVWLRATTEMDALHGLEETLVLLSIDRSEPRREDAERRQPPLPREFAMAIDGLASGAERWPAAGDQGAWAGGVDPRFGDEIPVSGTFAHRPGRLEFVLEMPLPTCDGRLVHRAEVADPDPLDLVDEAAAALAREVRDIGLSSWRMRIAADRLRGAKASYMNAEVMLVAPGQPLADM